jgi:hypothetical protein
MWSFSGLGYATNITDVEMLPAAKAVCQKRLATYGREDTASNCFPEGPRASPVIHTDGRPLPTDQNPTWMGYSIGRWDGDTFVVETTGFNDRTWLDFNGHPHTEALRVTERFHRTTFGHMNLEMTFDDPKAYVAPFTIKMDVNYVPDDDLIEYACLENEKDRGKLVGRVADEKRREKKLPVSLLSQYAGTYNVGPLGNWTVSVVGDHLAIELGDGGGKQQVFATADNVRDSKKNNAVTHFLLTIVEGDFRADRK